MSAIAPASAAASKLVSSNPIQQHSQSKWFKFSVQINVQQRIPFFRELQCNPKWTIGDLVRNTYLLEPTFGSKKSFTLSYTHSSNNNEKTFSVVKDFDENDTILATMERIGKFVQDNEILVFNACYKKPDCFEPMSKLGKKVCLDSDGYMISQNLTEAQRKVRDAFLSEEEAIEKIYNSKYDFEADVKEFEALKGRIKVLIDSTETAYRVAWPVKAALAAIVSVK